VVKAVQDNGFQQCGGSGIRSFFYPDPDSGYGMEKNLDPGSGIRDKYPILYFLELKVSVFWVKTL
jgi:hypothetical protein